MRVSVNLCDTKFLSENRPLESSQAPVTSTASLQVATLTNESPLFAERFVNPLNLPHQLLSCFLSFLPLRLSFSLSTAHDHLQQTVWAYNEFTKFSSLFIRLSNSPYKWGERGDKLFFRVHAPFHWSYFFASLPTTICLYFLVHLMRSTFIPVNQKFRFHYTSIIFILLLASPFRVSGHIFIPHSSPQAVIRVKTLVFSFLFPRAFSWAAFLFFSFLFFHPLEVKFFFWRQQCRLSHSVTTFRRTVSMNRHFAEWRFMRAVFSTDSNRQRAPGELAAGRESSSGEMACIVWMPRATRQISQSWSLIDSAEIHQQFFPSPIWRPPKIEWVLFLSKQATGEIHVWFDIDFILFYPLLNK